jgi:hypothetical protein
MELLVPVSIGLETKMVGENRQKVAFATAERRKSPLQACDKPKTGHFTHQNCLKANKYGCEQLL